MTELVDHAEEAQKIIIPRIKVAQRRNNITENTEQLDYVSPNLDNDLKSQLRSNSQLNEEDKPRNLKELFEC
jgi:hypothetical protein